VEAGEGDGEVSGVEGLPAPGRGAARAAPAARKRQTRGREEEVLSSVRVESPTHKVLNANRRKHGGSGGLSRPPGKI